MKSVDDMNRDELRAEAKERNIVGRGSMTAPELREAVYRDRANETTDNYSKTIREVEAETSEWSAADIAELGKSQDADWADAVEECDKMAVQNAEIQSRDMMPTNAQLDNLLYITLGMGTNPANPDAKLRQRSRVFGFAPAMPLNYKGRAMGAKHFTVGRATKFDLIKRQRAYLKSAGLAYRMYNPSITENLGDAFANFLVRIGEVNVDVD